ncbi:hypothetical protein L8P23_02225 [Enterobacter roggenkampii]|uniref:hypothetical protein n=1 Tax=Enterobacter roggenkampii TaxID=1812935 RepID=UPI002004D8A6|nr:hypothetical protein [Enterobacter roggenkampii]MCK7230940.1 hypothetical protein [Enterobacter roggenkampii]
MKLIDILVQELPKLGGWPIGADSIYQNAKGHLVGVQGCIVSPVDMELGIVAEDTHKSVTLEQYEAALSASKPEWDGEGLPPVGIEAEVSVDGGRTWCLYKATSEHNGMRLVEIENFTEEFQSSNWTFRPIRSEAEKKRDSIISMIEKAYKDCPHSDAVPQAIYEAIAEHIRID